MWSQSILTKCGRRHSTHLAVLIPSLCCLPSLTCPCVAGFQVALDDMKEVVAAFQRSLHEALVYVDERKPGMVTTLEKSIKDMFEKLTVGGLMGEHFEGASCSSCSLRPSVSNSCRAEEH